jgi:hypothetical protein
MKSALEYFAEKHERLMRCYSVGEYWIENCGLIAEGIARELLHEGKEPEILGFKGEYLNKRNKLKHKPLIPKPLSKGKVSWLAHFVCLCDDFVYDPIFKEPIRKKEYLSKMFHQEVIEFIEFTKKQIKFKFS